MPNYELQEHRRDRSLNFPSLPSISQLKLDSPLIFPTLVLPLIQSGELTSFASRPTSFFSALSHSNTPIHCKLRTCHSNHLKHHNLNACTFKQTKHPKFTLNSYLWRPKIHHNEPSKLRTSSSFTASTACLEKQFSNSTNRLISSQRLQHSDTPASNSDIPLLGLHVAHPEASNFNGHSFPKRFEDNLSFDPSNYLNVLFQCEQEHQLTCEKYSIFAHRPLLSQYRRDLISWLYGLYRQHSGFGYPLEVFFLTIQYFDRFVIQSTPSIASHRSLYLLGIVCLSLAVSIASDHTGPSIQEMASNLSPYKFHLEEVNSFRMIVLAALKYQLNDITPLHFIHEFLKQASIQGFIHSASRKPLSIEFKKEQWKGHLSSDLIQPILNLAKGYLSTSLFASPGTFASAIAISSLNLAFRSRFQQLDSKFQISVCVHPRFLLSRMVTHQEKWIQEFKLERN